jgi:hypothetical protein
MNVDGKLRKPGKKDGIWQQAVVIGAPRVWD